MSSDVIRYTCGAGDGMYESKEGDYIDHDDYLKLKLEHQLFIGKISDEIGFDKTVELLKECKEALK